MKKIDYLNSLMKSIFGRDTKVSSTDYNGQYYYIDFDENNDKLIFVDRVKNQRLSIKFKFDDMNQANDFMFQLKMWDTFMNDGKFDVKLDCYIGFNQWGKSVYVCRIRTNNPI